jgi:hypothetical protein
MRTLRRLFLGLSPLLAPSASLAAAPVPEPGGAGPQGLADILDIKPPLAPVWDPSLLWWGAGALALLLLGVAAWLLWRRRKAKARAVPPLAPHEIAARELDALGAALDLSAREFYFRLSTVFRGYLEAGFALKALEMTSEELLPQLKALPADAALQAEAKTFLRNADPVKYARREVDRKAMLQDFDFVRRFVDASKPGQPDV